MVVGFFVKLALGLAVVVLVGFNAFTVIEGHVATPDDARTCAAAAASSYKNFHSMSQALTAAQQAVGSSSETVVASSLRVLPDGDVRLELRRRLHTVLLQDIPGLKSMTTITVGATSPPEALP